MPLVLLTRPRAQSEAFARSLPAIGWDALIWPVMEIVRILSAPPDLTGDDGLVFTSARGVEALTNFGAPPLPAYCVGPATADAARRAGFGEVIEAGGDAEGLLKVLKAAGRNRLIHIRGRDIAFDIVAALTDAGIAARGIIAYEAQPGGPPGAEIDEAMQAGKIDAAAFFSRRSATLFAEVAPASWRLAYPAIRAAVISAATAEPIAALGFAAVDIAESADGPSMRALLRRSAA